MRQPKQAEPKKFYAVRRGLKPGIYTSWGACESNTKSFKGAVYKRFSTRKEAESFIGEAIGALAPGLLPNQPAGGPSTAASASQEAKEALAEVDDDGEFTSLDDEACLSALASASAETGSDMVSVSIFTDGSCLGNGKVSARAGVGVWFGQNDERNIAERLPGKVQTNNRAELTAVIRAIESADKHYSTGPPVRLVIYSDSQYMRNGLTKWIGGWQKRQWKTSDGKDVANKDLWVRLLDLQKGYRGEIKLVYVPAHTGIPGNEGADALANRGAAMPPVPGNLAT
ncbi:hypothetical protein PhCBS80983_g04430 [Powellomyces hirtus]|uniref:Ribonuclease H n=1 Tax=Powellomyces hirtus TaxID=109895 RepID=A0A507DYX6_9FUNG|nr:hypothetical protein PhCBS80983_g04430 [Powellomyces hirtus]